MNHEIGLTALVVVITFPIGQQVLFRKDHFSWKIHDKKVHERSNCNTNKKDLHCFYWSTHPNNILGRKWPLIFIHISAWSLCCHVASIIAPSCSGGLIELKHSIMLQARHSWIIQINIISTASKSECYALWAYVLIKHVHLRWIILTRHLLGSWSYLISEHATTCWLYPL